MLAKLPELILDVLCDHLSYEDVLMLRCTCKSLKTFVDSKKFTTLHLYIRKFPFPRRLFYTGDHFGYSQSFHSNDWTILCSSRLKKRLAIVQKITIYHRDGNWNRNPLELDLNEFNCFRELTHLEIYFQHGHVKGKLNLPKLQIAAFQGGFEASGFELDCPKLRALKIKYNYRVTLTSATDQLEYLHYEPHKVDCLNRICSNLTKLSTIVFRKADLLLKFLRNLQTSTLTAPSLSEIRLEYYGLWSLDEVASILEDLRTGRRTEGIRFTLMGRPIHSLNELLRISELRRVFQVENFESHLSWVSETLKSNQMDINKISDEELDSYMHGNDLEIRNLKDGSLLFLNKHPELQFLLASARTVCLEKDIELDEEMIKKLKHITFLGFHSLFRPSDSITELVIKNCKSLRSYRMYHQTVTERLLEMMSEGLLNLEDLWLCSCRHETLKSLAKFRNLVSLTVDFVPQRDELEFIYENSRSLENVHFKKQPIILLRTMGLPNMHRLIIFGKSRESEQCFEFDTLGGMMEKYVLLENHGEQ